MFFLTKTTYIVANLEIFETVRTKKMDLVEEYGVILNFIFNKYSDLEFYDLEKDDLTSKIAFFFVCVENLERKLEKQPLQFCATDH